MFERKTLKGATQLSWLFNSHGRLDVFGWDICECVCMRVCVFFLFKNMRY